MATKVINLVHEKDYDDHVRRAATVIRSGGLVGFPTETVYGVGSRADKPAAVRALRRIKDRVETKPFTVHIGDPGKADDFVGQWSALGRRLVRKAWPGPLTLVVTVDDPQETAVVQRFGPQCVDLMYHDNTIGLRCPLDPIASELLRAVDVPVVAASANRAGNPPPRTADGVLSELNGDLDLLLDGGEAMYAKPSTVIRVDGEAYEILREGVIESRTIERFAATTIVFVCSGNTCRSPMAAAFARQMLAARLGCKPAELSDRRIHVSSAGVGAMDGLPPSEGAVAAMSKHGVDITGHRSQRLDDAMVLYAEYVFCMTRAHRESVLRTYSIDPSRVMLLNKDEDIDDPFGAATSVYDRCADRIAASVKCALSEITI